MSSNSKSFNSNIPVPAWRRFFDRLLGAEISALSKFSKAVFQWKPLAHDDGLLLSSIESSEKKLITSLEELQLAAGNKEEASLILLNGNLNHDFDIEKTLSEIGQNISRESRIVLIAYNPYLKVLFTLANYLGVRTGEIPQTFITKTDLINLSKLAGFEVTRIRPVGFLLLELFGLGEIFNRILAALPIVSWFSLANVIILRPIRPSKKLLSLSIVIPARNEKGNIENALKRLPDFDGAKLEILFVEGHSTDGTWEEIQRVIPLYSEKFKISAFKQSGKGKSDAVRLGFEKASHELLTILDADLTMPPELLPRFYNAYKEGLSDFINGSRLTYPMEGQAMRFLNRLGNVFFAKALSFVLGTRIGDSLCGTKLLTKKDYERMIAWRTDFGDFDPFGDFELLFPAAELGLGIIDVSIRYRDRVYGTTNIRRFYHGMMLLRMTILGFLKIRIGKAVRKIM